MPFSGALDTTVIVLHKLLNRWLRDEDNLDALFAIVKRLRKRKRRRIKFENLVLLLGIGGVGKTTLIKRVTHNPEADNSRETVSSFNVYSTTREVMTDHPKRGKVKEKIFLGFADYRGQNIGTLFRGLSNHQSFKPTSINTAILVVDLVPPRREFIDGVFINIGNEPPQDHPDPHRIEENCRAWSGEILKAVFGMLDANALMKIIIFINKVDLVRTPEGRNAAITSYQPLVERVEKFAMNSKVDMEVILGSIFSGHNCFQLEDSLKAAAVER